ncbi:hypothetical protein NDU88_010705, partial [Pleurodeles waltl]
ILTSSPRSSAPRTPLPRRLYTSLSNQDTVCRHCLSSAQDNPFLSASRPFPTNTQIWPKIPGLTQTVSKILKPLPSCHYSEKSKKVVLSQE